MRLYLRANNTRMPLHQQALIAIHVTAACVLLHLPMTLCAHGPQTTSIFPCPWPCSCSVSTIQCSRRALTVVPSLNCRPLSESQSKKLPSSRPNDLHTNNHTSSNSASQSTTTHPVDKTVKHSSIKPADAKSPFQTLSKSSAQPSTQPANANDNPKREDNFLSGQDDHENVSFDPLLDTYSSTTTPDPVQLEPQHTPTNCTLIHVTNLYTMLNLSYNNITSLPPAAFSSLPGLQSLDLSHNSLEHLAPSTLNGLENLISVNLSHNSLVSVPSGLFCGFEASLQIIDVSFNALTTVHIEGIDLFVSLQQFSLENNSLRCDCHMLQFSEWYTTYHFDSEHYNDTMCVEPPSLRGRSIAEVPTEEMCDRKSTAKDTKKNRNRYNYILEKPTKGPLVYDPMLGWKIGATLSIMLAAFLLCCLLDKLKRRFSKYRKYRRVTRELALWAKLTAGKRGVSRGMDETRTLWWGRGAAYTEGAGRRFSHNVPLETSSYPSKVNIVNCRNFNVNQKSDNELTVDMSPYRNIDTSLQSASGHNLAVSSAVTLNGNNVPMEGGCGVNVQSESVAPLVDCPGARERTLSQRSANVNESSVSCDKYFEAEAEGGLMRITIV